MHIRFSYASVALFLVCGSSAGAATRVGNLRVESRVNPLAVDTSAPRFSWVVQSGERAARQSAYQILVAGTVQALGKGQGDVWDSGKVASDENIQIEYKGAPLVSRRHYAFVVRTWDAQDRLTTSAPAFFETGVLDRAEWKARFVGLDPAGDDERQPLAPATWIWASVPPNATKIHRIIFRHSFTVSPEEHTALRFAELHFAGPGGGPIWGDKGAHRIRINDSKLRSFGASPADPRALPVTAAIRVGQNTISVESPFVPAKAVAVVLVLETKDGKSRVVTSDGTWRVRTDEADKPAESRYSEDTQTAPWVAATERGKFGAVVDPKDPLFLKVDHIAPPILVRKSFTLDKPVARARLYATAAGIYEARVNGKPAGTDVMAPGWTDYDARLRYQTYDVTSLLKTGQNVIGATVADGWMIGRTGMGRHLWGFDKGFFAELVVQYKDGSSTTLHTDDSWRGATGPLRRADQLDGEVYDARRAQSVKGWDAPGFKDGAWRNVKVIQPQVGPLEAQIEEPVRVTQTIKTVKTSDPAPGTRIFDLGQNMVGWIRLHVRAKAGTRVTLRYAEILNKDGSLFTENLRSALATDHYIAAGTGDEVYEPRFTFHGFRYVEVTGIASPPSSAMVGVVVNSDLPRVGTFDTSNASINRLQSNIVWGQRGNFISIPTDCPQRDERLGWTGDINMFARTAAFNMDSNGFLAKYMIDLEDGQDAEGRFPDVAPNAVLGLGKFAWADVGVMLPWLLYETYGDRRVVERHYVAMKKWVDFRTRGAKDYLNTESGYGDWVSPTPQAPNKVIGPIYHAHVAHLLGRMAGLIGKAEDATAYEDLSKKIRSAWNRAYVNPEGKIESDTQAAYVLALRYNMLPEEQRAKAVQHLAVAIGRAGGHLATGFLGTGNLLPALTLGGRNDLAYDLLMKDTYPSWLYTVKNGATTMWERWNSYSPETGPADIGGMNSYNHYAFGAVGEWMYEHVAGLDRDPAALAWKRVVIHPVPGGGLTHARASYVSPRGTIESGWKVAGGHLTMNLKIPVHATARIEVPTPRADAVTEGGKPAAKSPGVRFVESREGVAVYDVGAGTYRFDAPLL